MITEMRATSHGIRGALPDYWERAARLPLQPVDLPEPADSPTRLLSPIERATVRVEVPKFPDAPRGMPGEALFRLSLFEVRGLLPYMSGHDIAKQLHYVFFSTHPVSLRYARRGWVLLAALDAADIGAVITLSAEALPDDPRHQFRRMRMHTRLDELERAERLVAAPR